jgi:nitroimidazol reductase NimA-like FMN-containing flavoprotein (pyridoxamine 5'-phosphate oxidase superfamily)
MKIATSSAWPLADVETFLERFDAPLRLAATREDGFPMLCSLWFRYEAASLYCATQRDARIARALARDDRCAFELAPNEPPYHGVRGRGRAVLHEEGGEAELERLIDRYLGDRTSRLASWLLSRADDEVVLEIRIEWITAWDYRARMSG